MFGASTAGPKERGHMAERMGQPYAMLLRLAPGLRARPRLHEEGANRRLGLAFLAAKASWAWACACVCVCALGSIGRDIRPVGPGLWKSCKMQERSGNAKQWRPSAWPSVEAARRNPRCCTAGAGGRHGRYLPTEQAKLETNWRWQEPPWLPLPLIARERAIGQELSMHPD